MDTNEDEGKDSIETTPEPNRKDKHKSPEVEEVDRSQSRKKAKALKEKNIDDTTGLTSEELEDALSKSTEVLTKKWSEFAAAQLQAITGGISELKDLAAQSVTSTVASSTPVSVQPDIRQWPA